MHHPVHCKTIFSVYRAFHREIRLFPTSYVRQFLKIKLNDDTRTILSTRDTRLKENRVKRLEKDLRRLRNANGGKHKAFDYILDTAYGRRGKLRWELLDPILDKSGEPVPPRIIPSVERSRPPVYTPSLFALMTSGQSTKKKALSPSFIARPPSLPKRADPDSEEARLLGPFSKRREVNIRWRFYTDQVKRVYPPMHVVIAEGRGLEERTQRGDKMAIQAAGIRPLAMQDTGIFEQIEAMAMPPSQDTAPNAAQEEISKSHLRPRFLRRRFGHLLGKTPVLVYSYPRIQPQTVPTSDAHPRYQTALSPLSLRSDLRFSPHRLSPASQDDLAWVEASNANEKARLEKARLQNKADVAAKRMASTAQEDIPVKQDRVE